MILINNFLYFCLPICVHVFLLQLNQSCLLFYLQEETGKEEGEEGEGSQGEESQGEGGEEEEDADVEDEEPASKPKT